MVDNLCLKFIYKNIPKYHRILVTKLRLSAHTLAVETGRYRNIEKIERICINCNLNTIEDEYHLFENVLHMTI